MAGDFDLKRLNDKAQIKDALMLPQRINRAAMQQQQQQAVHAQIGPQMSQVPAGAPTPFPQQGQPMAGQLHGFQAGVQAPMAGGMVGLGANVSPTGGLQGVTGNASLPMGQGQFDVNAALNNAMQLQMLQGRYNQGPMAASASYAPGQGVGGELSYQQNGFRAAGGYNPQQGAYGNVGLSQRFAKGGGVWTRKEGQNPEGGLNAAGRASLKAQGHDIKPPVSAKQAKRSPKAAARRDSFCARMSGAPGPMKDDKGRPTRKALALRKWDC